jgi:hypothetical protein
VTKRKLPKGIPAYGISIRMGRAKGGCLGHFEMPSREIVIDPTQPWCSQNITLLHELLHAVDQGLIDAGLRTRKISHAWIEHASMNLWMFLVHAGLWRGVSSEEAQRYYRTHRRKNGYGK